MDISNITSGRNPPIYLHATIEIPVGGVPVTGRDRSALAGRTPTCSRRDRLSSTQATMASFPILFPKAVNPVTSLSPAMSLVCLAP